MSEVTITGEKEGCNNGEVGELMLMGFPCAWCQDIEDLEKELAALRRENVQAKGLLELVIQEATVEYDQDLLNMIKSFLRWK